MESTPSTPKTVPEAYISNPFILAFNAFSKFFSTNAGWGIALIVLGVFGSGFQMFSQFFNTPSGQQPGPEAMPGAGAPELDLAFILIGALIILVIVGVVALVAFTLQAFIGGMFAYVALESQKGRAATFNEAFHATTQRFGRLFIAQAWAGIKIFLWSLLFIIPGIIAALRYALLPYVIMAEPATEKSATASHNRVKAITKGKLMEIFGLGFAAGIIPIVGGVLQVAGSGAQYQQLASSFDHKTTRPKTHWLNYLALAITALFLLLLVGLGILLFAFAASSSN